MTKRRGGPKGGTFIFVHDKMPDHPKIEALSDAAFRALITLWCYCGEYTTDGRVAPRKWAKTCSKRVENELLFSGLVEAQPDGSFVMHDFLVWQRSAAEREAVYEAKLRAGRRGNHQRWHVDRDVHDPDCEFCVAEGPDPDPSHNGSHAGSHMRSHTASQVGSQNDRRDRDRDRDRDRESTSSSYVGGGSSSTERTRDRDAPPNDPSNDQAKRQHCGQAHPPGVNCWRCREARREAADREREQAAQTADERRDRRAAIDACNRCDDNGITELGDGRAARCQHPTLTVVRTETTA